MKILYGVQATGNGHITRSRVMCQKLRDAGHDVHVIFSGRDEEDLWDVDSFHPYEVFRGLTFATDRGRIKYLRTAKNAKVVKLFRDVYKYQPDGIDLVITDFEPVTAYIAKIHGIKSLGIGHQYAFSYDIPLYGQNPATQMIMKIFGPADLKMGLHWHHFDQPILPPIIPKLESGEVVDNKIMVYLPFENQDDAVELLMPFKDFQFHVYTDLIEPKEVGHISVRALSRDQFLKDLVTCKGVISNAGFELPSEALSIGKKILVKPLKGQMEQMSNMEAMRQLGWGMGVDILTRDVIEKWLNRDYIEAVQYPDVAESITEWIGKGEWSQDSLQKLADSVWGSFPVPEV